MRTSLEIGSSSMEQMNLVLEFVTNFDVQKLLYAINGKRLDEGEIVSMTNDIAEYNLKLSRQKERLYKYGKVFNKRFANEDNNYFDASLKVSRKINSGLYGIKRIIATFRKTSRKRLPEGARIPQAHERSMISTPNYMADMFGLQSYPPCVGDLFETMLSFYRNMDECIAECMRILDEEKDTRKDASKLSQLLASAQEESKRTQACILMAISEDPQLKQSILSNSLLCSPERNPILKDFARKSKEDFAREYFHNCTPADIDKITLRNAVQQAEGDPLMLQAMTLFGDNHDNIKHINYIIEHFDELLPEKCKREKIPALNLYFFYEWCSPVVGIEAFLRYFNKLYKDKGGRWETIGKSAVTGACTKHSQCRDGSTQKVKDEMIGSMQKMLYEKFPDIENAV